MKALFCGSRDWTDAVAIELAMDGLMAQAARQGTDLTIVHGGADGADALAATAAFNRGLGVQLYAADWARYGRAAGPLRNQQMLGDGQPDIVVAFSHDLSVSRGTADMVRRARQAGVPTYVIG